MPKVSEEYLIRKRNHIMDAALYVYKEKPVFAVTMQDIINRAGLSQGAIYRYFQDVDDVLIAVYNRCFDSIGYSYQLDKTLDSSMSPEKRLRNLLLCYTQYIGAALGGYSKIRFELLMLYIAYPKRGAKIKSALKIRQSNHQMLETAFSFVAEQVEKGYFRPIMPLEKIISFAAASYDGILFDGIFYTCYPEHMELPPQIEFDAGELIHTLCDTVIIMLGGKPE